MAPELHQVAGNLAMPGFTAPKTAVGAASRTAAFRPYRLHAVAEGFSALQDDRQKVSDMSDAAGTGWMLRGRTGPTLLPEDAA